MSVAYVRRKEWKVTPGGIGALPASTSDTFARSIAGYKMRVRTEFRSRRVPRAVGKTKSSACAWRLVAFQSFNSSRRSGPCGCRQCSFRLGDLPAQRVDLPLLAVESPLQPLHPSGTYGGCGRRAELAGGVDDHRLYWSGDRGVVDAGEEG